LSEVTFNENIENIALALHRYHVSNEKLPRACPKTKIIVT